MDLLGAVNHFDGQLAREKHRNDLRMSLLLLLAGPGSLYLKVFTFLVGVCVAVSHFTL